MQARSERDAWVVEVRSGGVAAASGREAVKEVALAWLAYVERLVAIGELRTRTLESYRTGVMLHLIPDYGHRRVRSITTDDLVEWHRKSEPPTPRFGRYARAGWRSGECSHTQRATA